ncbi:glycosyltransferase [Limisphaera ngatamarikiensis]|uniref:Glycosyltransferase n=1 Tax=Limisphaera ngatamarikiensis TaxID=1324935 RepID=A0A6M1RJQ7_9BACT|nr:glycosyltransferase [Limisphaera ngatamarikiensis]NGO37873.1 glycosyltransferase [Limisphaera ngatamarikiensis]
MTLQCLDGLPEDFWLQDPAVRRLRDLVERSGRRIRAVSFDFFDTLVWRWTERPVDVFAEVGTRLGERGMLPGHVRPGEFRVYRQMAEVRARRRLVGCADKWEDITLREIVEELRTLGIPSEVLVEEELGTESDVCCLNPALIRLACWLRERGVRVLVVSDVYLSAEHLARILRANGCDPGLFDRIYTSADHRVCKGTANLFRVVLRQEGLKPEELVHVGDNLRSDLGGAWKAGIRAVAYTPVWPPAQAALERETFLPCHAPTVFTARWLRLLAMRRFAGETPADFFGRAGALLMGPVLSGFAAWACEQFEQAGVRRVGAFMREGALLGRMLEKEARARGWMLEVRPLYANRLALELASLGRLTADALVDWLGRRQTLSVGEICAQLGLSGGDLRGLPLAPDERLGGPERILQLARWLFEPQVARRIEARSAEERQKVLDYLKPWFDGLEVLGVCDIGYNATAQYQIHQILRGAGHGGRMLGCYVLTCEVAAWRALDGLEVRSYLGEFGTPRELFWAFLRSPAFVEQLINAPCGTTVGYRRQPDGTVEPRLSEKPLPEGLRERQRWFQDGVQWYQDLWLWVRKTKGWLGPEQPAWLKRWRTDLAQRDAATLARVAAFPLPEEVEQFGDLVLDDRYFEGGALRVCKDRDREILRSQGYVGLLRRQDVLWPQGTQQREQPRSVNDYFAFGRAMLTGAVDGGAVHQPTRLMVLLPALGAEQECVACLERLRSAWRELEAVKFVLLAPAGQEHPGPQLYRALQGLRYTWSVLDQDEPWPQQVAAVILPSEAPRVLWLRPDARLSPQAWARLTEAVESEGVGAVLPAWEDVTGVDEKPAEELVRVLPRCVLVRRTAWEEGMCGVGNVEAGWAWARWLGEMEAAGWAVRRVAEAPGQADRARDARDGLGAGTEAAAAGRWEGLEGCVRRWLGGEDAVARIGGDGAGSVVEVRSQDGVASGGSAGSASRAVWVNWEGSFLDHGSLSHVNRELTGALERRGGVRVHRVQRGGLREAAYAGLAGLVASRPLADAAVTVRHGWPPDWSRPVRGRLVVIQPWEFGALPEDWVRAAAQVDEFWVPSGYVRDVYVDSGVPAEKVRVIPNGVDIERFHPGAAPRALPTSKRFRFLFVGGTIPRKGPDVLLRAYLEAFTAADDVCLVIKDCGGRTHYAGQTLADRIDAVRRRPGAPEIVYLDEEWGPEELPGLYTACHCLVLPYRGEGFGLPVLEAMACGLPVIVTAGGATDDFVGDGCGWRVAAERRGLGDRVGEFKLARPGWWLEPGLEGLARAMRAAYEDESGGRVRGGRGRACAERYSWARVAEMVEERLRVLAEREPGEKAVVISGGGSKTARPIAKIELPPCARLGHLGRARELMGCRRWAEAWRATLAAMSERPFHPEAWLLLAQIAQAVGAGRVARQCGERARRMAPGYAAARQFLKRPLQGSMQPDWMRLPEGLMEGGRPRLSVGLIVRNEEAFLDRCLSSVRGVADQIVVVDTGSTDRTVEIARSHGAEVYEFAWCDDFSAARNAVLEHVRGDWVLMLDADEELTEEGRRELPAALTRAEVMAWRLPMVDVGREEEGVSYVPRLFRNAPGLFYVGRVHEQVFSSVEVRRREWGLDCRIGKVLLRHHGYRPEVIRDRNKIERNLRLLELAVQELPGEPHLLMNLGLELARLGREAEALERYREAFRALSAKPASEVVPELRETLLTQMASRLLAARRFDEVVEVLSSSLARGHGGLTASLHFALGLAQLERGQYREAAGQMRLCLEKRDRPALSPILKEIRTAAPHHCLAVALWRAGDGAGAEAAFQEALRRPGVMDRIRLDYARYLVEQRRPVDALRVLTECVTEKPDAVDAWRLGGQVALSTPEFLEFARDWTGEAMRYVPADPVVRVQRATALMLGGDCEGALELWRQAEAAAAHPETVAARLVCEAVTGRNPERWTAGLAEAAVSRAWLSWYQRLHRCGAQEVLLRLHETVESWATLLPTAAGCLRAALAEAGQVAGAGAG